MTRSVALTGALVAAGGCAQLFGIDNTTGPSFDAPTPGAHVSFRRASIGTTTITAPLDLTATNDTVAFLVPDGSDPSGYQRIPGVVEGLGSWRADITTVDPLVEFTLSGSRHLWALPTRDLRVESMVLEHPNADAPSPTAALQLDVTIPAYAPPDAFVLEAIGAWTYQSLTAPAMGATTLSASLPYAMFLPFTTPPLARIVAADTVVLLRHNATNDLTGVFQTSFEQLDTNTLSGTLATVVADRTLDANVNPTTLATRYTAVRPGVSGLSMSWSLVAAPGYVRGYVAGPQLAAAPVAMADTKISHMYGNPFTSLGWNEVVYYATSEGRTYTPPGGTAIGLGAGLYTVAEPSPNLTLDLPAGMPESISINDVPLATDNMTIAIDAQKYAHVTFVADHSTNAAYHALLFKVGPSSLQLVIDAMSTDPNNLWFPPDAFESGSLYTIEVVCVQGSYPNIATGDVQTTMPPFHNGYNDSGVFTANKP